MLRSLRKIVVWFGHKKRRWAPVALYLALLTASKVYEHQHPYVERLSTPAGAVEKYVETPAYSASGVSPRKEKVTVRALVWEPEHPDKSELPIVLLHGSPGDAANFARLGPELAKEGRRVIAFDLPGFGGSSKSVPDYSVRAHARYAIDAMSQLGVTRAHILGFSMGGGVALNMIDLAPECVASLTMLSAIGVQEAEGSGSYAFEHAKYGLGYGLLVLLPKALPDFGALDAMKEVSHSFIRNFWDTDQRPLRAILERITIPTLILQGRNDPLVFAWAAEEHHRLVKPSSLVIFDASHFMVFGSDSAAKLAANMSPFLSRHDAPGVAALRFEVDQAPVSHATGINFGPFRVLRSTPWWALLLLIIAATWISEDATVIAIGVLIAHGQIDWGVGLIGCFVGIVLGDGGLWALGRFAGRRALHWPFIRDWAPEKSLERWGRWFDRHTIQAVFVARAIPGLRLPTYFTAGLLSKKTHGFLFWAALAAFLWTPILLILAIVLGPKLLGVFDHYLGGPLGVIVSVIVIFLGVRVTTELFTWVGRRKLLRDVYRLFNSEFWPHWLFYMPLAPWLVFQSLRRRGAMSFTCVNPDVPHGGGVVGESKHQIIRGLLPHADRWVVRTYLISCEHPATSRAGEVDRLVNTDPELGGYPVVLKPDESQMGHGFKIAHNKEEAERYFEDMTRDALLQQFDPGPHEVGVLWARDVENGTLGESGRIISITRKEFPVLVGDGVRTLERLIWAHPRYRMQANVFLRRFAGQTDLVLEKGERFKLGVAGNHAQGATFLDGQDLMTPELDARVNEIASGFTMAPGVTHTIGGFDFGRFDIRYASDEELKRGEKFAIVELNGTLSESTNLYDPRRSIIWSYSVLFRQWETLYRIGAARRRMGVKPMRPTELLVAARDHYKGRPGSSVSD